jgi:hypothetical protein
VFELLHSSNAKEEDKLNNEKYVLVTRWLSHVFLELAVGKPRLDTLFAHAIIIAASGPVLEISGVEECLRRSSLNLRPQ